MNILLQKSSINTGSELTITGSKSESNRLLLLQALYPELQIKNCSNSDDSELMQNALNAKTKVVDIHHAGTAMRFLTAFFAIQEGQEIHLTGSKRMKERPIKILVEALKQLGADIVYLENQGFPPLKIVGKTIVNHKIALDANISSQYISALLLVAPKLKHGLELTLIGEITSLPYIEMTLNLLNAIGVETTFVNQVITVKPKHVLDNQKSFIVESDWSSASYFYSIMALSEIGTSITLSSYKRDSLQGDSALVEIYKNFGVETYFEDHAILLKKENLGNKSHSYNLNKSPDIAQTIAVTCFALGASCHLTGLKTLKIKETDRLEALKTELSKLGADIKVTIDSLSIGASNGVNENCVISTYNDHRMAMAFAPLAIKVPINIEDAGVVSKSYPSFWDDLESIGFQLK